MKDFINEAVYLGVFVSLVSYGLGSLLRKKIKLGILNPLLIAIITTIAFLVIADIDYDIYYDGAKYISYLLTPATIALAVPLYEQFEILKKNYIAVFLGIISGVITSMVTILGMALMFNFSHEEYVTFLPKSITTAIGMTVSEELNGYVAVSATIIIITGVIGNVIAEAVFKIFKIKEPVAKGLALGTASHAVGTAKAMELGEIEGALSSLSIVVAGILTVISAPLFANIL